MSKVFDKDKQNRLLHLLENLSNGIISDEDVDKYVLELTGIYDISSFRHSYSELTTLVIKLYKRQETDLVESLISNIRIILDEIKKNGDENSEFYTSVYKLYDHINMESIRCAFYKEYESDVDETVAQIRYAREEVAKIKEATECYSQLEDTNKRITRAMGKINHFSKENKNLQTQVISILGIFSAIVVAFFGGFSYFTSTFSNLHNIAAPKAVVIASILGIVIYNTIYILLNFILYFVKRSEQDRSESEVVGDYESDYKPFGKFISIWTNVFFVVIMLAATVYWLVTN